MDANIFDLKDIWRRILERSQKEDRDALEGFSAYLEKSYPDPELEKLADSAIDTVCAAQLENGYLDTYYIIGGMDNLTSGTLNSAL